MAYMEYYIYMAGYHLIPLRTKQGVWTIDKLTLHSAALNQIAVMLLVVLNIMLKSYSLYNRRVFLWLSLQRWVTSYDQAVHMVITHTFMATNLVQFYLNFLIIPYDVFGYL